MNKEQIEKRIEKIFEINGTEADIGDGFYRIVNFFQKNKELAFLLNEERMIVRFIDRRPSQFYKIPVNQELAIKNFSEKEINKIIFDGIRELNYEWR